MGEQKNGVQAHDFRRWLVGYTGTNPQFRSCVVHFDQDIISCSLDNASNGLQPDAYGEPPASPITADGLLTNEEGEIVLLVKLETFGLGENRIRDVVRTILNCDRYKVRGPGKSQY